MIMRYKNVVLDLTGLVHEPDLSGALAHNKWAN